MSNAGRPKKSQAVKELTRTDRADRPGSSLPALHGHDLPEPPKGLQVKGKRSWERAVSTYAEMGVFNPLDLDTLETYCQLVDLANNSYLYLQRNIKEVNEHNTELKKELKAWETKKKEAEQKGNEFTEEKPKGEIKNPLVKAYMAGPGIYEKPSPHLSVFLDLVDKKKELSQKLALDPKSRSQINFPKPKSEDGFDQYLSGKGLLDFEEMVDLYCSQVMQGVDHLGQDFLRGEMEKGAVRRYLQDLERQGSEGFPYIFDKTRANYMLNFAKFMRFVEGTVAGQKVRYEPWQAFIHWNEYGWVNEQTGKRRFTVSFVAVARKNNKTTLNSVQQNFHLYADLEDFKAGERVEGGQVYSGASSLLQASICFGHARKMILKSHVLEDRSQILKESVYVEETNSVMRALHSDSERLDGFNPSFATIDEYHAHRDSGVYDKIRSGQAARSQPFIKVITTAGFNMVSPCHEMWDTGRKILRGEVKNEDWFIMIFEPDEKDNWEDPTEWRKANPNWNESINSDMFQKQFEDAQTMPSKKLAFKQLNLNLWSHSGEDWLTVEQWAACGQEITWEDLRGRVCYLGFDLAERKDVCAVSAIFKEENGGLTIKPLFFLPSAVIDQKTKDEKVPYRQWVDDGFIYVVGEDTINMDDMIGTVLKVLSDHEIQIAHAEFDKHQALQVMNALSGLGYSVDHTPQTFSHYNEPTRRMEADVIEGRLTHDQNPVLAWMIQNVKIIMQSHTEYVKPVKKDQLSKIDGIHSTMTGLCGMKKADDIPPDSEEDYEVTSL